MIKNYFLFAIFLFSSKGFSQELYVKTAKNFTKYNYTNEFLQSSSNLQSGSGNSYELGFTNPDENEHFSYGLGISLNEYNAIGSTSASSYRWDTQYLGAAAKIYYSFLPDSKNIDFLLNCGLNGSTIIYGKQQIDGTYYDLVHQKEFSGIWIGASAAFQVKYQIESFGYLSLDYSVIQNLNVSNTTKEKLSFSTQQIQLGFHFPIN
ncbi:hypothetical protein [uncultured Flavobacterium sp.]|uniref:hypothetical protein n=1 Tax=uncultured Flavobacterium sp. TaxID=165435 RepID=UPI0030CA186D